MATVQTVTEVKKCKRCNRVKAFELFAKHNMAHDGRQAWCRDCQTAWAKLTFAAKNAGVPVTTVAVDSAVENSFSHLHMLLRQKLAQTVQAIRNLL